MNVLAELSKKDKQWRQIAYKLTGNKQQADELVQTFYLKVYDYNITKEINAGYVYMALRNIWYTINKKNKKDVSIEGFHYLEDKTSTYELDDTETEMLESLTWLEKEFLVRNQSKESLRAIAKESGVSYGMVYQHIKKSKMKVIKDQADKDLINKVITILDKNVDVFPLWIGGELNAREFLEAVIVTTKEVTDGEY